MNNALLDYERSSNVFMLRGIFIKLIFPYVQYPTKDLFPIV